MTELLFLAQKYLTSYIYIFIFKIKTIKLKEKIINNELFKLYIPEKMLVICYITYKL